MSQDLYKLGQSQKKDISKVGEEIRLDVELDENPYLTTGVITGEITDDDDKPIEGALVKILDSNHNPLYHALSQTDGSYKLVEIDPGSEYHFHSVKDGYLISEETTFSIIAGQTLQINSKLSPDPNAALSTITGHVVDQEGNPVENLMATLVKVVSGQETVVATTTTNEYGQGVFMNVELGDYIIRTTKQGYEPVEIEIQITDPGSITSINAVVPTSIIESQGTINGLILDKKSQPVEGAVVILYEVTGEGEDEKLNPIRYTRTIENGAYLFGDVPKGKYVVKSNKEV